MERQLVEQTIATNDFDKIVELAGRLWSGDQTVEKDRALSLPLWEKAYSLNPNDNLVCRRMGSCYRYGYGTEENDNIALPYYMQAALRDDTFSQYFVGLTLEEKKDPSCIEWFEKACNNGDADSAYELANIYYSGVYVQKDEEKAEEYLKIVENSKEANAAMNTMRLFYFGPDENGERDLSKAIFWCKKAIEFGSTEAVVYLELLYEKAGMDITGCADFLKAVENNGAAYMWLYRYYKNGEGISPEEETKILLKAANNNDTDAMLILYYQFKSGTGVAPDINQALDWLYKAVDMNDARAYYELGNVYVAGNEQIERNEQKAFECYNRSFGLEKNADAAIAIMKCYYFGTGVPRDLLKAEGWAKTAILNGNRTAAHNLRKIEVELYGESQGYTNYINFILNEAINYNDEAAIVAYQHYRNILNDYPVALNYLEKSFNNRNPDACFLYGSIFYTGEIGVQKDIDRAYQIWEIGVQSNSSACIHLVGNGYLMGEHYPKDIQKGLMYIRDAAHRGNKDAAYKLGLYYMAGSYGVPIDTAESTKYVILAAQLGHTEAKNELGLYYMQGSNGLPKDIEKGVALVKEAADAGSAIAQFNMGNCYYNGQGVNRDFLKSIEYYKMAEAQGYENATKMMELLRQLYTGI